MNKLDLTMPGPDLTEALVNISSVSGTEEALADEVEAALSAYGHLKVFRHGNTVVARTDLGRDERIVIAGHLDTVPLNDNLPARRADGLIHGLGACDMKGGVAVGLRLAATLAEPNRDVTYVFYDCEEVEADRNGLFKLTRSNPELLEGVFAVVMEPSNAVVEAGCQGTMRIEVTTRGERAHSARSWMGTNAIHAAGGILARLAAYEPRRVPIDGLEYREGLNAVAIRGGVAGNVVPDLCTVEINYRFAPSRSEAEASAHLQEVFDGFELAVTDSAPGGLPGLERPAAAAFLQVVGGEPKPKFGWTDVARFTLLGVPAVNYGPGDPLYAHKQDEFVPEAEIELCEQRLRTWLTEPASPGW
ncbi:succinyl-diaminopimelate desuccinylase [Kribbella pittospori]|uniref:Succinyl-diaminopimelate desuccinylase n=1 Tax=Kribbella pittospori TaxID=722689 RepID=A0A4V6N4V7_9ACTN|nr:succinyl-diaminopimelate desuccinylase [Kribbella pittospori]TCC60472.1 succinyl-diaminopimelate desuccinylase [Kribbella pittospori]